MIRRAGRVRAGPGRSWPRPQARGERCPASSTSYGASSAATSIRTSIRTRRTTTSTSTRTTTAAATRTRTPTRAGARKTTGTSTDLDELTRHAVHVLPEGALEEKLKLGRPLRVKLGVDPTAPDIHLGFAFALENLRRVPGRRPPGRPHRRRLHRRIGDPSGRSIERPVLARRGARRERAAVLPTRRSGSSTASAPRCGSTANGSAS